MFKFLTFSHAYARSPWDRCIPKYLRADLQLISSDLDEYVSHAYLLLTAIGAHKRTWNLDRIHFIQHKDDGSTLSPRSEIADHKQSHDVHACAFKMTSMAADKTKWKPPPRQTRFISKIVMVSLTYYGRMHSNTGSSWPKAQERNMDKTTRPLYEETWKPSMEQPKTKRRDLLQLI